MSIIDKKPFIVSILDTLSADDLKTLRNLINGVNGVVIERTLKPENRKATMLSASDKGIKEAKIILSDYAAQTIYNGYLIYNNHYCVLISYSWEKSQLLTIINMVSTDGVWKYQIMPCDLSITDLRSELNDRLIEAGGAGLNIDDVDNEIEGYLPVVELNALSGTLTDDQYTKVQKNNCVIKAGTQYYYKEFAASTLYTFKAPARAGVQNSVIIEKYQITKADKTYELITEVVSAGSAPVAYEGTSLLPEGVEFKSWTLHRAIQDGNILWIVLTGTIENTTGTAKNVQEIMSISLPLEIQQKIYRWDGTTIDQAYSSNYIVAQFNGQFDYTTGYEIISLSAGTFKVELVTSSSINGNDIAQIDVRFPIFLNIGEVPETVL